MRQGFKDKEGQGELTVDVLSPWCSLAPSRMLDAGVHSIWVTESARRATVDALWGGTRSAPNPFILP